MDFIKKDIIINNKSFYTLEITLPKTTFILVGNEIGFIMCGALDVTVYDTPKMIDRKAVCARCFGVKSISDLLNANIAQSSSYAKEMGVYEGMNVTDALSLLS